MSEQSRLKVSHIVQRVANLDKAVAEFQERGFKVEYGSSHQPHNALIYFSEGPYLELLEKAPLNHLSKLALRMFGKTWVVDRLARWGTESLGVVDLCLETNSEDFALEECVLKRASQNYFVTKSERRDPHNRHLKWKLLFPQNPQLPFMMTPFNIDPKPKNLVHPNGVKCIKRVSFATTQELVPLLEELCNDPTLMLVSGQQAHSFEYGT